MVTEDVSTTKRGCRKSLPAPSSCCCTGTASTPACTTPCPTASRLHATLRVFPGDLHDVLNEHDRDIAHEGLVAFVDEFTLAPAPTA